jgi:hypothetical protein
MTDLNVVSKDIAGSLRDPMADQGQLGDESLATPNKAAELVELLYLLKLGVKTNLRWIGREKPDIDAARMTSARLCQYVDRLETLIASARPN